MSETPAALASATLAQLYVQQDHLEQARRVLGRVLAADPFHGQALALAERLAARSRARLYAVCRPGRVVVRWHDAPQTGDLHLILATFRALGPAKTCVHVTSARCLVEQGEHAFPVAADEPASASLCLARPGSGGLELLAVHEAVSW